MQKEKKRTRFHAAFFENTVVVCLMELEKFLVNL